VKYLYFFLVFSLFIILPVKFEVIFQKMKSKEYLNIYINFFGLIKLLLEIPDWIIKINIFIPILSHKYSIQRTNKQKTNFLEKIAEDLNTIKSLAYIFKRYKKINQILNKSIKISYIKLYITISSENPAVTGFFAGQTWAFAYFVMYILSYYFNLSKTTLDIKVTPVFNKLEPIHIDLKGIFHLRVGHIIIASFMIIWYQLTSKRIYIPFFYSKYLEKGATK